jgi:hypothetical protein
MCLGCSAVILLEPAKKAGITVGPAVDGHTLPTLEHGFDVLAGQCPMGLEGMSERENLATVLLQQ